MNIKEALMDYDAESIEELIQNVRNKAIEDYANKVMELRNLGVFIDCSELKEIAEKLKGEKE